METKPFNHEYKESPGKTTEIVLTENIAVADMQES